MRPAGVSLEHEDRVRSYSDVEAAPDYVRDGLHRRPTHTVSVDLDRLSVSATAPEAGPRALETDELEGVPSAGRPNGPGPRSLDPQFVQRAWAPGTAGRRGVSPQPQPNPIAVEVAERYAKALTLGAAAPLPPEARTPRRSRAAMRDRALDPGAAEATPTPRSRSAATAPAPRPATTRRPAATTSAPAATPAPLRTSADAVSAPPVNGRRTVTIRGRGAERDYGWATYDSSRRPSLPAHERPGFKPDRAALWAVFLGLLLVLVAATSAHAAVLAHAVH
jgi:hypothetical protein